MCLGSYIFATLMDRYGAWCCQEGHPPLSYEELMSRNRAAPLTLKAKLAGITKEERQKVLEYFFSTNQVYEYGRETKDGLDLDDKNVNHSDSNGGKDGDDRVRKKDVEDDVPNDIESPQSELIINDEPADSTKEQTNDNENISGAEEVNKSTGIPLGNGDKAFGCDKSGADEACSTNENEYLEKTPSVTKCDSDDNAIPDLETGAETVDDRELQEICMMEHKEGTCPICLMEYGKRPIRYALSPAFRSSG